MMTKATITIFEDGSATLVRTYMIDTKRVRLTLTGRATETNLGPVSSFMFIADENRLPSISYPTQQEPVIVVGSTVDDEDLTRVLKTERRSSQRPPIAPAPKAPRFKD